MSQPIAAKPYVDAMRLHPGPVLTDAARFQPNRVRGPEHGVRHDANAAPELSPRRYLSPPMKRDPSKGHELHMTRLFSITCCLRRISPARSWNNESHSLPGHRVLVT